MSVFDEIRSTCREVTRRARSVRIREEGLAELAHVLAASAASPGDADPAHRPRETEEATVAHVITLDAVNFGSGWFPHLDKRPGCSGYFTIANALSEHFDSHGPMSAGDLRAITAADCAALFGQRMAPPVDELMALFARAWRDLGSLLIDRHGGSFVRLVDSAAGRAAGLVAELVEMPLYRDVSRYEELEVPLYKRAQITCVDLHSALEGRAPGAFTDLAELTLFADNLVPHVLRMEGALEYSTSLLARISAEEQIPAGSLEEIEIRAVALDAVERMVELLDREDVETTAHRLDHLLWHRGQSPTIKAEPRHRTRSAFY